MASSSDVQTVNPNFSNSKSGNVDGNGVSTTVSESSSGEFINQSLAQNRIYSAREAERLWTNSVNAENAGLPEGKYNKIRLVSTAVASGNTTNTGTEQVAFNLSPEISESKQVIYAEIGDIRQAASILIYGGSPSRKWSINAKFLSRTTEEADATWYSVQLMRSWTNPDSNYKYGIDSGTPRVLRLYGYGRTWKGIPVVLTSINIDYPTDIDYIQTSFGSNVPIIHSVSLQLTEARKPDDLLNDSFNLEKFKLGVLPEW